MKRPWLGLPWPDSLYTLLAAKTNDELVREAGFEPSRLRDWRKHASTMRLYAKNRARLESVYGFTRAELPQMASVLHRPHGECVPRGFPNRRDRAWMEAFDVIGAMYRKRPEFRCMADRPTVEQQRERIIREGPHDDAGMRDFWKEVERERQAKTA